MNSQVQQLLPGSLLVALGLVDYPSTDPFLQGVTDNILKYCLPIMDSFCCEVNKKYLFS
jgi:hypothetical protein